MSNPSHYLVTSRRQVTKWSRGGAELRASEGHGIEADSKTEVPAFAGSLRCSAEEPATDESVERARTNIFWHTEPSPRLRHAETDPAHLAVFRTNARQQRLAGRYAATLRTAPDGANPAFGSCDAKR